VDFFAAAIAARSPASREPQIIRSYSRELTIFKTNTVFLG